MGVSINVQVLRGGQLAQTLAFDSDTHRTIKIGRLSSAQVKLDDPKVSRIHAVIEFTGNEISLIDMGSTEGTLVNGQKVHKVKLNPGDQIGVGDSTLVVGTGAPAAAATAPQAAAAPSPAAPPGFPAMSFAAPAAQAPSPFGAPAPAGGPSGAPAARPSAPAAQGWPAAAAPAAAAPAAARATPAAQPAQGVPRFDPGSTNEVAPIKRITQQRLRSAAVESKPHPALAPEQVMTPDNRVLEMRLYWGEVLLGINHWHQPKRITIGETKNTNVFITSEGLPVEEFPLVRYADAEYLLTFSNSMEGELELGGQVHSLQQLRGSSIARKDDQYAESYGVKLPPESRGIVHWGGVTFALRFVPPSEGVPSAGLRNLDLQYLNFLVMSLFFHVALVVTFLVYPYDTESLREDLFDKPDRFANLILEAPKPTEQSKNLLEKIKKDTEQKREELAQKQEQQKPTKELKVTQKVPANIKPQKTETQKRAEVAQKFSKLFSGSGGGAGSLLGGGGGGSLSGTLSNVIGTAGAGSASGGMAGLGIRGTGPLTGGGVGTSRGIAGIGTSGRHGGGGLAYGSNVGIGKRKEIDIGIGTPAIMGALPPEVIKKVIDENKNQIRYCYEIELQRNQNLEGRVAMKWVIAATGAVAKVNVRESTIKNANVENCIMAKIRTWRFPPPAGGGIVEVNYPFIFKSS